MRWKLLSCMGPFVVVGWRFGACLAAVPLVATDTIPYLPDE
jgi:hypothetical protein